MSSKSEDSLRRLAISLNYRIEKTPSRHWTRKHYGVEYMLIDSTNTVILGAHQREYSASLDEIEAFLNRPYEERHPIREKFGIRAGSPEDQGLILASQEMMERSGPPTTNRDD